MHERVWVDCDKGRVGVVSACRWDIIKKTWVGFLAWDNDGDEDDDDDDVGIKEGES